jgi:lipopolysaccharide export system permease protein
MRLSIIDRYIGREIAVSWLSVFFVLLLVILSADAIHLLSWVVDGRIPGDALLPLLLNTLYEFSVRLIPLSLLLGILLAFGRLYKDSEMTAIMMAGLGTMQWYRPLLFVAVPTTLLMFLLTLVFLPAVAQQHDRIMTDIKNRTDHSTLFAGRFNQSHKGNAIFFLESQREGGAVMDHVFYSQKKQGVNHVDIAIRARNQRNEDGRDFIVMEQGTHYEGVPGSANYKITEYEQYGIYVPGSQQDMGRVASNKAMPSSELWESQDLEYKAELQWRLTIPVSTLIIAMLALPLSHTTPRSGRYANLALAIAMYLVYSNLLSVSTTWIEKQAIPVWVGSWWVHILALVLLFLLLKRRGHNFGFSKPASPSPARGDGT